VGVAAARLASGEERVAVGAVSDRPLLIGEVDGADIISDLRGSADYRRRMVDVHARRALGMLDG
jgi:CO/xanthine dehydrogenase FAD-binding subunit